jgi:hypothetical protein
MKFKFLTFPVHTIFVNTSLIGLLTAGLTAGLTAAEPEPVAQPVPVPAAPEASPWTTKGRFGVFFANSTTMNADNSLDPTIGGSARTTTMLLSGDFDGEWKEAKNSVQNIFKVRYGRQKTADQPLSESDDEVSYNGVYRRELSAPHFLYAGWGVDSVWTGPYPNTPARPPDNSRNLFDPLTAKVSTGYGQRYSDLVPEDKIEWRLGVRAQKRWGTQANGQESTLQTGPEAFARYEGTPLTYNKDLKYFGQYEAFAEFNDLQHLTNVLTAGLSFQFSKYLNLDLALRAYYETRPKEFADNSVVSGYSQWSIKQDTMIGVAYSF